MSHDDSQNIADLDATPSATDRSDIDGSATEAATDRPAVGIIATADNGPDVACAILRAQRHGYAVFVVHSGDSDIEGVTFARQLGATVLAPAVSNPDTDELRRALKSTAQAAGHPQLIIKPQSCHRIDFADTTSRLDQSGYVVEATDRRTVSDMVVVGIPAYNEAETIRGVVTDALEMADMVIVADDGSGDETAEIARNAGATVIEHDRNQGYGTALQTLFEHADAVGADHLVIMDADGQHEAADIPALIETQQDRDVDIVIGSRFIGDGDTDIPLYRRFGIGVVNVLTNLSLGLLNPTKHISDTQCGFRAYNASAISSLARDTEIGNGMDASTDILHHAYRHDYDIEEVGTTVYYDLDDTSELHPLRHGATLVHNILTTVENRHPILLLGLPGMLSILGGIGFALWALDKYLKFGGVPFGLSIAGAFLILAGVFSCFTAIILHSLQRHLPDQ